MAPSWRELSAQLTEGVAGHKPPPGRWGHRPLRQRCGGFVGAACGRPSSMVPRRFSGGRLPPLHARKRRDCQTRRGKVPLSDCNRVKSMICSPYRGKTETKERKVGFHEKAYSHCKCYITPLFVGSDTNIYLSGSQCNDKGIPLRWRDISSGGKWDIPCVYLHQVGTGQK